MLSKRTVNAGNGTLESERPFPVTASNLSAALGGCISTSFARANYSKSRVVNRHSTGELAVSPQASSYSCILDITRVVIIEISLLFGDHRKGPPQVPSLRLLLQLLQLFAQEDRRWRKRGRIVRDSRSLKSKRNRHLSCFLSLSLIKKV